MSSEIPQKSGVVNLGSTKGWGSSNLSSRPLVDDTITQFVLSQILHQGDELFPYFTV